MFGIGKKKQKRAEAPVGLCSTETAYARAWNKSDAEWLAMSPEEARDARDRVSFAPNMNGQK